MIFDCLQLDQVFVGTEAVIVLCSEYLHVKRCRGVGRQSCSALHACPQITAPVKTRRRSRVEPIKESVQVKFRNATGVLKIFDCKENCKFVNFEWIFFLKFLQLSQKFATFQVKIVFYSQKKSESFNFLSSAVFSCTIFGVECSVDPRAHVCAAQFPGKPRRVAKNLFVLWLYTWSFGTRYSASSWCSRWRCFGERSIHWRRDSFLARSGNNQLGRLFHQCLRRRMDPEELLMGEKERKVSWKKTKIKIKFIKIQNKN